MRTVFLAGIAAFALTAPARAQMIVNDPMHQAMNALSWARQVQDMTRQYQQLRAQYDATARMAGAGSLAGNMGGLGRTYTPPGAAVPGMMAGTSTWGSAEGFVRQNRRYMPAERDAWVEDMERRERTTANAQAMAAEGLMDTDQQLEQLAALQAEIDTTGTVVDAQALNVQMTGFRQNLELNRSKLEQARVMMAAQERAETLRAEQSLRESADSLTERTRGAVESLGAGPGGTMARGTGGW